MRSSRKNVHVEQRLNIRTLRNWKVNRAKFLSVCEGIGSRAQEKASFLLDRGRSEGGCGGGEVGNWGWMRESYGQSSEFFFWRKKFCYCHCITFRRGFQDLPHSRLLSTHGPQHRTWYAKCDLVVEKRLGIPLSLK